MNLVQQFQHRAGRYRLCNTMLLLECIIQTDYNVLSLCGGVTECVDLVQLFGTAVVKLATKHRKINPFI
mgnify:CR=1 FL=1